MFFKQVRRNAAKNRRGSGLYFGSLVIAIVAFYTLLSLDSQDVMRYLATVESDAVGKLLMLLPVVYGISLFFLYFLVYFACNYQLTGRRRELGMYLMLGMKRSRMFFMLLCETLWSSLISLAIGIPVALLLTEGISLTTAKWVGLGIIGHQVSFSGNAILWTVIGSVVVQLLSMGVLSGKIIQSEPAELLKPQTAKNQQRLSGKRSTVYFLLGLVLLIVAYYLGIFQMQSLNILVMVALLVCGTAGTFLLYRGLGGFWGLAIARKSRDNVGLDTFTARQVQETVLSQHKSLAISSLLLMMALSCVAYGISMGLGRTGEERSVDFCLFGEEEQIEEVLHQPQVAELVGTDYPLYLAHTKSENIDTTSLEEALDTLHTSQAENIIENLHIDYVLSESSYNHILQNLGMEPLNLGPREVALYSSMAKDGDFGTTLQTALESGASLGWGGTDYALRPTLYYYNIVADRAITIYLALIVPDDLYTQMAGETEPYCRNLNLKDSVVAELGLMQASQKLDTLIASSGLEYDTYLDGMGRNLFYSVAASYLTVYLGVVFWLIANTVIGLKYLISQRRTRRRYETLALLGANGADMKKSVKKQINVYFALVLVVALCSSVAAVLTLFGSFTKLPVGTSPVTVAIWAAVVLAVFAGLEALYIGIVQKYASRECDFFGENRHCGG